MIAPQAFGQVITNSPPVAPAPPPTGKAVSLTTHCTGIPLASKRPQPATGEGSCTVGLVNPLGNPAEVPAVAAPLRTARRRVHAGEKLASCLATHQPLAHLGQSLRVHDVGQRPRQVLGGLCPEPGRRQAAQQCPFVLEALFDTLLAAFPGTLLVALAKPLPGPFGHTLLQRSPHVIRSIHRRQLRTDSTTSRIPCSRPSRSHCFGHSATRSSSVILAPSKVRTGAGSASPSSKCLARLHTQSVNARFNPSSPGFPAPRLCSSPNTAPIRFLGGVGAVRRRRTRRGAWRGWRGRVRRAHPRGRTRAGGPRLRGKEKRRL